MFTLTVFLIVFYFFDGNDREFDFLFFTNVRLIIHDVIQLLLFNSANIQNIVATDEAIPVFIFQLAIDVFLPK